VTAHDPRVHEGGVNSIGDAANRVDVVIIVDAGVKVLGLETNSISGAFMMMTIAMR